MNGMRFSLLVLACLLTLGLSAHADETCPIAPAAASSNANQSTQNSGAAQQASINPAAAGALVETAGTQGGIEFGPGFASAPIIIEPAGVTIISGGGLSITAGEPFRPPQGVKWETLADVVKWNRQRAKELRENALKYREEAEDKSKSEDFRKAMENLANECEKDADSLEAQADRLESDTPQRQVQGHPPVLPLPDLDRLPREVLVRGIRNGI